MISVFGSDISKSKSHGSVIVSGSVDMADFAAKVVSFKESSSSSTSWQLNNKKKKFHITPSKWDITQGKITTEIALQNRKNINLAIKTAHELSASTINLDEIDAYFSVSGNNILNQLKSARTSIRIPSDTHFEMTDNTYLRIQPSNGFIDYLLHASLGNNITISGGHLIGDRYEHDYSPVNDILGVNRDTHEYGAAIILAGVTNTTVDNVDITSFTGDGILCNSSAIRYADGSPRKNAIINTNIIIKNSTITQSRRNNISLTDGNGYLIENCIITNSGLDITNNPKASGTWPKASICLEAYRETKNTNGFEQLLEYEKVTNVTVRNNRFTGNKIGIVFVTVSHVLVEDNFFDDGIGSLNANHCIVRNNTFERSTTSNMDFSRAIAFNSFLRNDIEEAVNNEVSGNTITGYQIGIGVQGEGAKIFNNKVYDFQTGLHIGKKLKNTSIHDNLFSSKRAVSYGYFSLGGSTENVIIENDQVKVMNRGIFFLKINKAVNQAKYNLLIKNCTFRTKRELYLKDCKNITFKNTSLVSKIIQVNCQNITEENTIKIPLEG